ncbi:MAG: dUTP diphosphatase [Alphaproteobacteria bacterium]|nr:dUTP diphosphatase [Alphaproteobacteria bacterium]
MEIKIKKLSQNAIIPTYATELSAGLDIFACISGKIEINPGEVQIIPSGIGLALPEGYEAQIRPRSGLAAKNGVTVLNSPGTIDADYRGEVKVILINHGANPFIVENEMRIAQLVVAPVQRISFIEGEFSENETARGSGGFGSTG